MTTVEHISKVFEYIHIMKRYDRVKEAKEKCIQQLKTLYGELDLNSKEVKNIFKDNIMTALGLKDKWIATFTQKGKQGKDYKEQALSELRIEIQQSVKYYYNKLMKDLADIPVEESELEVFEDPEIPEPSTASETSKRSAPVNNGTSSSADIPIHKRVRKQVQSLVTTESHVKPAKKHRKPRPELLISMKDFKPMSETHLTTKCRKEIIESGKKIIDLTYDSDDWKKLSTEFYVDFTNHNGLKYRLLVVALNYITNFPLREQHSQASEPAPTVSDNV